MITTGRTLTAVASAEPHYQYKRAHFYGEGFAHCVLKETQRRGNTQVADTVGLGLACGLALFTRSMLTPCETCGVCDMACHSAQCPLPAATLVLTLTSE